MTAFGLILIPACLIGCTKPIWLLQLTLMASVFEAAAAVALGGLGVQPSLVPAAIFVPFVLLQLLLGVRYMGQGEVWRAIFPFMVVTAWAVVGAVLLPHLFAGAVTVWPQKLEPPFAAVPLEPTGSNINQVFYLVINCSVLMTSALFLSQSRLAPARILNAYFLAGYVAVFIGIWQFANKLAGVPFPDAILYSNPGWSILDNQQAGLAPRINGSFSEPSSFAGYLAGVICCTGWMALKGHASRGTRTLLCLALLALLISTSTTGYAVLAMIALGLPIYAVLSGSRGLLGRVFLFGVVIACVTGVAIGTVVTYLPNVSRAAQEVVDGTLNKGDSSSYEDRSSADLDSLGLLAPTYGLGVGWGSNRSSSLIPGTLAGLGVYGTLGLVWFGFGVNRLVTRARQVARDPEDAKVIDGASGAVLGMLAAALVSGPTIGAVSFYLMLGLLIGTAARAASQYSARQLIEMPQRSLPVALFQDEQPF